LINGCWRYREADNFSLTTITQMQRDMISADAIKQELFKNAGYGGGCL